MSTTSARTSIFHSDLKAILPRLRLYALSLTRDRDRAEDLVQETVVKALAGQKSFRPGSSFSAWIYRIERNEFISGLRRLRPAVTIDDDICNTLSHPPHQDSGLVVQEFLTAFGTLPVAQREALVLSVVDGQSYAQIARHAGMSVGTIKSRVSRARDRLERLLLDEEAAKQPPAGSNARVSRNSTASRELRLGAG
jgi:RNA polymerase sigma-70 factor (ECF subfamily)